MYNLIKTAREMFPESEVYKNDVLKIAVKLWEKYLFQLCPIYQQ